jgi:diacylglycerol kinase (ATP)
MHIAPGAEPDDGLFDVVIVADISRLGSIRAVPRLYRGTHLSLAVVEVHRARSIDIAAAPGELPPLFDVDGEQVGRAPAQITICPGALRFAAPT